MPSAGTLDTATSPQTIPASQPRPSRSRERRGAYPKEGDFAGCLTYVVAVVTAC